MTTSRCSCRTETLTRADGTEQVVVSEVCDLHRICDFSDLPASMCGHCQGIGPTLGRVNPTPTRRQYPAGTRVAWTPTDDKAPTARDWNDGAKTPQKGTRCRWNRDLEQHLLPEHLPTCVDRACNGCKPCTHDDHGNPVTHCRARTSCTEHLDHDHPHTCPRCIARVRADLDQIERLTTLMVDQATYAGLDSTAAVHAGPAADPDKIERRTLLYVEATRGHQDPQHATNLALTAWAEDTLDERHPLYVLRKWETQIRELYLSPAPTFTAREVADLRLVGEEKPATVSRAIAYLTWILTDLAQDPAKGYQDLASEINDLRKHLENVLGASRAPERGAPCKDCDEPAPRLQRRRAHWCDRDDCTREHDLTGARDTWVCPRNPQHWWTEAAYRKWSVERATEFKHTTDHAETA